jgi:outer membrane protein assembly factor BamB
MIAPRHQADLGSPLSRVSFWALVSLLAFVFTGNTAEPAAKPKVNGFAQQRVKETLDRGLVVRSLGLGKVYASWRLLEDDPAGAGFNLYRRQAGELVKVNAAPLRTTTDFVDQAPSGDLTYTVRLVDGATEAPPCPEMKTKNDAPATGFVSFPLTGKQTFQKVAIADLDGDGRYDYVLKQPNENVDPYKMYWKKSPGTYTLEAYNADGRFLWKQDLRWSIEQGIWYSPYVVYDLDGDGRAEVALKAGEGDPRDADGRVQTGPEHLLILDGQTGKEKTRADWPSREGFEDYNRYSRNQLGIAYLDGKTPFLLVQRGTYSLIKLQAYEFHQGKLREVWRWQSTDETPTYNGQGAHCLRAGDIDADGRDEVILGSAVIDDNGSGLWTTRLGHPDHVYIGDLDPARPGLEIYYGIESKQKQNGMCMVDAATGRILWGLDRPSRHVHGQGMVADLLPEHPGCETYSADTDEKKNLAWVLLHNARGQVIAQDDLGGFAPKAAYWDGDVQRELIRGRKLQKLNGPEFPTKLEGTVLGVADVFGDWREEIITTVAGEMRIYMTTIPAKDRRVCLMQDRFYRADISTASQGYYQIPTPKLLPGTETPR